MIPLHHRRFAPVLLPQRRLVKHHRVPAHRRIEKQPGNLPVLRQIDQPACQPGARAVAADIAVFQPYPPGARRSQTVERFGEFSAPGSDQPGEADDLPGADLQAEIDKTFSGQIFYPKDREILRLSTAIARQRQPQLLRVAQRAIAADRRHRADQLIVAVLCGLSAQHHRAIAHYRDVAGDLTDLRQFVRDKHDPDAERL